MAGVWVVPAEVIRVVDADTVRLRLSLGWHVYRDENCRIHGVNAPELRTMLGKQAAAWAYAQLPAGTPVMFESRELDKYGRPLGRLSYPFAGAGGSMQDFGQALMAAGHAVPYDP